ncbi:hypothetical protein Zmor_025482 [Zophobas morio]|uniref:Uncharacterized protein n=1 Tax=Zophobas morio TaxID=2755281 RepID=A0AA38HS09_9CUCU|nr:hypothetical protein Zmor_025482 [Zophobas morio]
MSLKSNVLGKNKEAIEKMMQTIVKVKDKLLVLDNILVVQIEKDKTPVITKILLERAQCLHNKPSNLNAILFNFTKVDRYINTQT